jgi:hypothetical protein
VPKIEADVLRVTLNGHHPFYERFYQSLAVTRECDTLSMAKRLELLLLAAARAEVSVKSRRDRKIIVDYRRRWSDLLAAFLG